MTSREFIEFWGSSLERWSAQDVQDFRVPASAKRFLMEVGLPTNQDWTLEFNVGERSLPLERKRPNLRRIGYDASIPICLDEDKDGQVVAVEETKERFVNSSVVTLAEFLVLYQLYRQKAREASEEEVLDIIASTKQAMRHCDPAAFRSEECYWPAIIEQMDQGLL